MVLDTHTHAWGRPSEDYPWVNDLALEVDLAQWSVDTIYTAEKLLKDMDKAGIDEAVLVGYPVNPWNDNRYTVSAVAKHERLKGIVLIDQFAEEAVETLNELMIADDVIGFRVPAMCAEDQIWSGFDTDATWLLDNLDRELFWQTAEETNAVVQLLLHYTQLDQAIALVESYPDLTVVIDHVARLTPDVSHDDECFVQLAKIAEHDNIAIKISEVPHASKEGFPFTDMHDHVRWLLDNFGHNRVIWGSDYPNGSNEFSYRETLQWLKHMDGVSDSDWEWITERAFRDHTNIG